MVDVVRYVEVVDVKGHKQLVDDGFREEGLLVLYTRSAKPATGSVSECTGSTLIVLIVLIVLIAVGTTRGVTWSIDRIIQRPCLSNLGCCIDPCNVFSSFSCMF